MCTKHEISSWLQCSLQTLEDITASGNFHLRFSELYLLKLKGLVSSKNINDVKIICLKEGSYYLGNAYRCLQTCLKYELDGPDISRFKTCMDTLEFDPNDISSRKIPGIDSSEFASLGAGKRYYDLLYSSDVADLRCFINLVETSIDNPVRNVLKSISKARELIKANEEKKITSQKCEEDNSKQINEVPMKDVGDDESGMTELHIASKKNQFDSVIDLLESGAIYDAKDRSNNTALNLATNVNIIELLKTVDSAFQCASAGDLRVVSMMKAAPREQLAAIMNARRGDGKTLISVVTDQISTFKRMAKEMINLL